ncbi:hypothetical protein AHAS_Ahas19G0124100 [Arachis hypogaea]
MARDLGMRRIVIEVNSIEVYEEINLKHNTQRFNPLLREIEELQKRPWELNFQHTSREGNMCADWLAKESFKRQNGFGFIDSMLEGMESLYMNDRRGIIIADS